MTVKRWFLGASLSCDPMEEAKNGIARKLNHYIFRRNWAGEQLERAEFTNMVLKYEEIELALAARLGKLYDAQVRWENIKTLLK